MSSKKYDGHKYYVYTERPTESHRIYVAGSRCDRYNLQNKMNELKSKGYTITSYWLQLEDRNYNPIDYKECSRLDIDGVVNADTVLIFMTDKNYPYRETFTELGCAIGSGRRIILICNGECVPCPIQARVHCTSEPILCSVLLISSDQTNDYKFSHECMNNIFFWDYRIEHVSTFEDAIKLLEGKKIVSNFQEYCKKEISKKLKERSIMIDEKLNQ